MAWKKFFIKKQISKQVLFVSHTLKPQNQGIGLQLQIGANVTSLNCKQKLCGFAEDKNSNRRRLLICELIKVIREKTKSIRGSLIRSLVNLFCKFNILLHLYLFSVSFLTLQLPQKGHTSFSCNADIERILTNIVGLSGEPKQCAIVSVKSQL